MKKLIFLIISTLLIGKVSNAQTRVAGYSAGKPGTDQYEHLEFWKKDGKRTGVSYAYGKNRNEVKLKYLGKSQTNGDTCFKVQFTTNYILYIVPKELKLKVTDKSGNYNKTFSWEYEGPVNGIGTYCDVCVEDDKDAMKLIRSSYLK